MRECNVKAVSASHRFSPVCLRASTWCVSRCGQVGWGILRPDGSLHTAAGAGQTPADPPRCCKPTDPCVHERAAPRRTPAAGEKTQHEH